MARTSMEQEQVEEAIAAMFINSGLENKQELTFDDFKALMAEHMEQLSNASLKIQGTIITLYLFFKSLPWLVLFIIFANSKLEINKKVAT